MKKQQAIITVALLGFALAAFNKSEAQAPAANAETQMRAAYGFAAQMPADTATFADFYNLGSLVKDVSESKTWAAIRSNPLFGDVLRDGSFQKSIDQMERTNPDAAKWKAVLIDALGNEAFVALAAGSETKMHAWLELNSDMRAQQFQNALSGKSSNDALMPAILPHIKDLDIPPMIIGFKISSQKAALDELLAEAEKNLPPYVVASTFTVSSNSFKSFSLTVGKALPPAAQNEVKQMIEKNISDPQKADEIYQALLARHFEVAYGYVGDYFIISLGDDHAHVKFAASYADSLLAKPEVQAVANYTAKPVVGFSWATAEFTKACQQEFQLLPIYEEEKQALSEMMQAGDRQKLEADLKRLDTEAKGVFTHDFTPMVTVMYRDHGLCEEIFGGMKSSAPVQTMKFAGVPSDSTFVWVDQVGNQAVNDALRVWVEDFFSTSYDTFLRVGLPLMPPNGRVSFTMFQAMALPKIIEFYHITRDQFAKSLGLETAFAMDLDGEIPEIPGEVPPEIHAGGKMMRIAVLSDLRDRALLGESWNSYFKLAGDIEQMAAQMSPQGGAMFPAGLPEPMNQMVDGVALWYYNLPMPTGDLLPNIAVTDKTFVAGTSRAYSVAVSKAALNSAAAIKPMGIDVRVNFKPAFDFADKWLALAAKNPDLFFKGDRAAAMNFKKSQPDLASLLQCLRGFEGMTVQSYQENGLPRISSQIRWDEK